jgi:7,8-dihydroneopterin aldolase/epimerase/oxygenase
VDAIFIEKLRVKARVGVYPREQAALQTLEMDVQFGLPDHAAQNDALSDTIDYALVIDRIRDALLAQHFQLLESLVEHLVALLFREFSMPWIKMRVAKLGVMKEVARVGVEVQRTRTASPEPVRDSTTK